MKKDVSELWRCMPLLYTLINDSVFDEDYVYKGFVFIISLVILPVTLPLYIIGRLLP